MIIGEPKTCVLRHFVLTAQFSDTDVFSKSFLLWDLHEIIGQQEVSMLNYCKQLITCKIILE